MAQEELIISSKASISYSLTLGNTVTAPGNYLDTLTLKQGDDVKLTEDKNIYLLTLKGVKVIKKIYQPTEIEADLDFIQLVSIKSDSTEIQGRQGSVAAKAGGTEDHHRQRSSEHLHGGQKVLCL